MASRGVAAYGFGISDEILSPIGIKKQIGINKADRTEPEKKLEDNK
ncbi:MAG: hypothetical protein K5989_09715 [Lachnospiraceae bacterium]|nr:hypothetical protein [Lachnospiraceae bacterium]